MCKLSEFSSSSAISNPLVPQDSSNVIGNKITYWPTSVNTLGNSPHPHPTPQDISLERSKITPRDPVFDLIGGLIVC